MADTPTPAASAEPTTLAQAMRAASLGIPTTGFNRLGVVSQQIYNGADALVALRESVQGCGYRMTRTDMTPYDCGEDDGVSIKLCGKCEVRRDVAIRTLIGVNNG